MRHTSLSAAGSWSGWTSWALILCCLNNWTCAKASRARTAVRSAASKARSCSARRRALARRSGATAALTSAGSRTSFSRKPEFSFRRGTNDLIPAGPPKTEAMSSALTAVFRDEEAEVLGIQAVDRRDAGRRIAVNRDQQGLRGGFRRHAPDYNIAASGTARCAASALALVRAKRMIDREEPLTGGLSAGDLDA